MSEIICEHEDFEAFVEVDRLANDEDALARGEVNHYVASVRIRCAECQQVFGFRVPDVGLLPDRPTVSPSATEMRVPLIPPSELELLGPDEARKRGEGPGFTVEIKEDPPLSGSDRGPTPSIG